MARRGLFDGAAIELGQLPLGNAGPAPPEPGSMNAWKRDNGVNVKLSTYMRRESSAWIELTTAKRRESGGWVDLFPAPPAGQPPNTYAGLTMWLDADNSPLYKGPSTSGGAATANNDAAERIDSNGSIARTAYVSNGGALRTAQFTQGRGILTDVSNTPTATGRYLIYTKPSGTDSPSALTAPTVLWSSTNAIIIWSGVINNASVYVGNPSANNFVVGGTNEGFGLGVYKSGTDAYFIGYAFDGSYNSVTSAAVPLGTPVVVEFRYVGGELKIRINGGAFTSTTGGDVNFFGGNVIVFGDNSGGTSVVTEGAISQAITYNAGRTEAEMLEVGRWCGAKLGLSF